MHTTEAYDNQTDEINKLAEEIGAKIARARRASGLSQWEFADKLGIPVCFTEILENGILVAQDNRYLRWNGCPFTRKELNSISNRLAKEISPGTSVPRSDSETVFFCPVTVNSNSIIDEIHTIVGHEDLTSFLLKHMTSGLCIKHRIAHGQICLAKGRKTAYAMKQRVKSVLSAYQKQF